ncbi:MAG TPA: FAD-dependent oxidoreductase [Azospirillaceae bacterium]|nr:FAD-dependent oxidoreductase [Azospirillaceae bacterium]
MRIDTDLCVIGAGSGGLSVAAGAAQMGARVVLIERSRMGGDCLNTGCVPSKAMLAAAKTAHAVRTAGRFGVNGHEPAIDFARVHGHVHGVIAAIAPHDSVERFEGLGVRVIRGHARFTTRDTVAVEGDTVAARWFVIATGSRPLVPPVPGLDAVPYLTNETLFERTTRPDHLLVIGGGPIGVEMAQAHRRLGSAVTLIEQAAILPKDDPELVAVVRRRLIDEGIVLHEGTAVARVETAGNGLAVVLADGHRVTGSDLLIATGRRPNVEDLDVDAAGIAAGPRGIQTDARLKTTNRRVFAIGDVAGGPAFTHAAGYQAGIVIRNALFRLPAKVDYAAFPWVTYSDPELAQVGLTEAQARERHGEARVLRAAFAENDRARAEGAAEGLTKVVTDRRGRILGASIVGPHAGEQIAPWVLAIRQKLKIGAMAGLTLPYPTLAEAGKRAAGSYFTPTLFSERTKKIVRFLVRW